MTAFKVLILGGYGTFGGRLAQLLADEARARRSRREMETPSCANSYALLRGASADGSGIPRIDRPLSRLARPAKREFDHLRVGRSAGDGPRLTSGRIFCGKPASTFPENAPGASWSHARALAGNA
jgi:hypothetical protein